MVLRRALPSLLGAVAVAGGLLLQWLLHTADSDIPFAPYSFGNWLIRNTPGSLATRAIDSLGHEAKGALALGVALALVGAGALLGTLRYAVAILLAAATLIVCVLDPLRPAAGPTFLAAFSAGLAAFVVLSLANIRSSPRPVRRREFIAFTGGVALIAVMFAANLRERTPRTSSLRVPPPMRPFDRIPDATFLEVAGLSPAITAPADHYVVDINFEPPVVDSDGWTLTITGASGSKSRLSLDQLFALPSIEQPVFLQCISNTVGGALASNGLWTCIPLREVLAAGSYSGPFRTVVARAADGYSAAIPAEALDEVVLAFAMSREPIPRRHGFPVRLLWPGRYGMLSVKWLTRLDLVDEPAEGYWAARGWDKDGLLKTGSRIDVPRRSAAVTTPAAIAGIAWARGDVSLVEISIDDEQTWQAVTLEAPISPLSWRRWRTTVTLPRGRSTLAVRAFDRDGLAQISESNAPHPGGATGIHRVVVDSG